MQVKGGGGVGVINCLLFSLDDSLQCIDTLKQRCRQSFVLCCIFKGDDINTFKLYLNTAENIILTTIKETYTPQLLPTQVVLIENNYNNNINNNISSPTNAIDRQAARDAGMS